MDKEKLVVEYTRLCLEFASFAGPDPVDEEKEDQVINRLYEIRELLGMEPIILKAPDGSRGKKDMKRLTCEVPGGTSVGSKFGLNVDNVRDWNAFPAFDKLGEYEDSGLSPAEAKFYAITKTSNVGINALVKEVGQNARDHGWWDGEERTFGELIALCHSELSEALQEYRDGSQPSETYVGCNGKPEGIPSELADTVIRIMDMCDHYGIDLEKAIIEKHQFNKSRPYRHGGKII